MARPLGAGEMVGRYRVVRLLERDDAAFVYAATALEGGGRVAVEEYPRHEDDEAAWGTRQHVLLRQSELHHPMIPRTIDHFVAERPDGGQAFYVVKETPSARTIDDLVANGWRAGEAEARRIAEKVLDVLDYLHSRVPPIAHGAVRPANLLREEGGKLWLADSPIVRGASAPPRPTLDMDRDTRDRAATAADLYGLGGTLMFAVSGLTPPEVRDLRVAGIDARARMRISDPFFAWLLHMTDAEPDARFRSSPTALRALREPVAASRAARPRSPMRLVVLASILGLLVLIVMGIAGFEAATRVLHVARAEASAKALPERPRVPQMPAAAIVRYVPAHESAVMSATYTPDGKRILTSSWDATVKVWDASTGRPLGAFAGHTGHVGAVRVTSDGRYAVSGGDTTIRVWSLPDGRLLRTIAADPKEVFTVALSPSGAIAGAGEDGHIGVWSLDGKPLLSLSHGKGRVLAATFAAGGQELATGGDDGVIDVWSTSDGKLLRHLTGHTKAIDALAVAPDGQTLASADDDHTARLWSLESGTMLRTLALHTDEVWTLAFSPDGGTLLTGGKDSQIGVWSIPTATLKGTIALDPRLHETMGIGFAPDGLAFATAQASGNLVLWRFAGGRSPTVPDPTIVASTAPKGADAEARAYADAMDLLDSYRGQKTVLDRAHAILKDLLDADPRSPRAYTGMARLDFKRAFLVGNDYDQEGIRRSLELANRALAFDPLFVDALVVKAWALRGAKDDTAAANALEAARKLAPDRPGVVLLAARLAHDDGDLDGAESMLRNALSRPVTVAVAAAALDELARIYWGEGAANAADEAYRREIAIAPDAPWPKGDYADLLIDRQDFDGAIAMLHAALAQLDYGVARENLARAYCGRGAHLLWDAEDARAAAAAFEAATKARASEACGYYGLGATHQYAGARRRDRAELAKARELYGRAAQIAAMRRAADKDAANDPDTLLPQKALQALGGP